MTNMLKTLIAGSAFLALSSTALADDTFSTTFTYNASAPVEVTYAQFQKTAKKACRISWHDAGALSIKVRIEKKCRARLIGDAVKATKIRTLIAYHNNRMELEAEQRKFANLRQDNSTN